MKNLKNYYKLLPLVMLFICVSCKKHNVAPNGEDPTKTTQISASELVDYYLVAERKTGKAKLSLMTFVNEGNVTKASLNGRGFLRGLEVANTNSTFTFNCDFGNFTYTLERDVNGTIKLKSYNVNGGDDLVYALLVKKNDASAFALASFKAGDLLFKFKDPTTLDWDIKPVQILYYPKPVYANLPAQSLPYYNLPVAGFKTNDEQIMGVTVPSWLGINSPVMLVEKRGEAVLKAVKQ